MKDALNYDINQLKEKQIISLSKIITDFISNNKEYFSDKQYSKEIINSINIYYDNNNF